MGSQGIISVKDKEGSSWRGVFNFTLSYPSELGRELVEFLQNKDLEAVGKELLKYTHWEEFLNQGLCQYCGQGGMGVPYDFSDDLKRIRIRNEKEALTDPEGKKHKHLGIREQFTPENLNSEIEWIYEIDPREKYLRILYAISTKKILEIFKVDLTDREKVNWFAIEKVAANKIREARSKKSEESHHKFKQSK